MSKSKKRTLHRNNVTTPLCCTRKEAISSVVKAIKNKKFDKTAKDTLSLFGISGEELSEAGITWEELQAVKKVTVL